MGKKITMFSTESSSIQERFEQYLSAASAKGLSSKTLKTYRQHFHCISKHLDITVPLSSLSRAQVDAAIVSMRNSGLSANSISSYLRAFNSFLTWCRENGYSGLTVPNYKPKETVKETYSDSELSLLLKRPSASCSFVEYRSWVIVQFLLNSGCRASTIRNIQNRDIDLESRQVTFRHTKTGKIQVIPLCSTLSQNLRQYMRIRGGEASDYLFCTEHGEQLTENALRLSIARYNRSHGVQSTSLHKFRHTFARKYLIDCGGNAFTLQWYIDEPAAEVVRKIFNLCLAGKGPLQIAKQLEKEKVLVPSAYYDSIGRKHSNPTPANVYGWDCTTIRNILENQQYTGCTVNGKSSTVSYKVHKKVHKPKEEYQIIFNTQEAIIDEQIWLRVQELRKNKRRNTATGRQSLFAGLLFCADCGSKLHFCAAKSLKRNQEFYRCANYKDGRGSCTIHYIRDVVLQQIVLDEISALADFVRCYGSVFRIIQQNKQSSLHKKRVHELTQTLENSKKRIADLDKLFTRIYEDNVIGKLPDDRYSKMAVAYEKEQKELELLISDCEKELRDAEKKTVDMKTLYQGLMEFTEIKELTPTIVNKLIKRIEIHNPEKKHAHNSVKVDITFTAIGLFQNPDEAELKKLMQAVKENSSEYKQISA